MIKKIVILKPNKSLNFSESINAGIKNSINDKVFIANDDIIISKETMERLEEKCDENTITGPDSNCNLGWLTNETYSAGDVTLVPSMDLSQVTHVTDKIYDIVPTRKDTKELDWLAFFATMVHRKCFDEVGLLDENFVYDKEDLDWCVRAKQKGKKFLYCFDSYCFHFGGVSRKKKHAELGLKHELDNEHNEVYYKNKYKVQGKPVLGFYCHDAWEYWDETSLNSSIQDGKPSGIGGSETQAILLCRELSKLGYKVKLFNKCKENHMDSGGYDVEYIPFQDFPKYSQRVKYNHFVASRYLDCFDVPFDSDHTVAMIHDVFLIQGGRDQKDVKLDKIDKYFSLSHQHKDFVSEYHSIPKDKILVTSNGLDFSRFKPSIEIKRDHHKLIYSSSPDRGLELLLDLFPRLDEKAHLHIYYGFENFRDQEYIDKILKKIGNLNKEKDRVFYHGRIGQDQLANEFKESAIWAYPSWFEETFCITALEAMAGGSVVLSSDFWGLSDTVKEGGILLPLNNNRNTVHTPEYQDKWVEECNRLLNDIHYQNEWRQKGYERAERFTWESVSRQWDQFFRTGDWSEIQ
ncbi:glycosyltransferase [bacterium]|nr:glycosyltransferase [bacterium]